MSQKQRASSRVRKFAGRPLVLDELDSARLSLVRQSGTAAELAVRGLLRRLGLRFSGGRQKLLGSPDMVNLTRKWAVFVHGCFWHSHQKCPRATVPKRNRAFWRAKFAANRERDRRVLRGLRKLGFTTAVVWECEAELKPEFVQRRLAAKFRPDATGRGQRAAGSSIRS